MSIPLSFLLMFLSAILVSLAGPNEFMHSGSSFLGLIALAPIYVALVKARNWKISGLIGGFLFFFIHLMSSFWLAYFKEFAIFTLGGSALAYLLLGFPIGCIFRQGLKTPSWIRPFVFAALWTVWEWFKSIGFLAYPWGTLIMSSFKTLPLIQIADITGTWGISFILSLFSALCGEILLACLSGKFLLSFKKGSSLRRSILFSTLLFSLTLCYGFWNLIMPPKAIKSINLVLVQQNIDSWENNGENQAIPISQNLTRNAIAESGIRPDLVVWSESILPYPYLEYKNKYRNFPQGDPFSLFLNELNAPLLVGSPVIVNQEKWELSNSAILISPTGEQLDFHSKIQLVPFAEYMPFTEYEWVRNFFDALVGFSRGWIPGTKYKTMSITTSSDQDISFIAPICFEDAFSSLVARLHNTGSELIINLTNDSWSKTASAEYQHHAMASFRAIELRTTLVRSTNGGYTSVIDPVGHILADLPLFKSAALAVAAPIFPHRTTFYARFGDWFPKLLAFLLLFSFFIFNRGNCK
ncbi:MAG TPA: apolipoprotein N-acyltransferase, partial [Treponemataceae bacterium]|nr:apolipoprotein N-acyltransferase [Treponemataceae bacterium]